jgi:hypothetical protein
LMREPLSRRTFSNLEPVTVANSRDVQMNVRLPPAPIGTQSAVFRHIHLVGCARDLHGAYLGLQPYSIRTARTAPMLLDPDVGRRNRWTTIERVPAWILLGEIVDVRLLQASRDVELNGCDPETEEHRACGQQRHDKDGTRDEEPLTKEEQQHEHCGAAAMEMSIKPRNAICCC